VVLESVTKWHMVEGWSKIGQKMSRIILAPPIFYVAKKIGN